MDLDELIFGPGADSETRLALSRTVLPFALVRPSRHEAAVFFLNWLHEVYTEAAAHVTEDGIVAQTVVQVRDAVAQSLGIASESTPVPILMEGLEAAAQDLGELWHRAAQDLHTYRGKDVARYPEPLRGQIRAALDHLESAIDAGRKQPADLESARREFDRLLSLEETQNDALLHLCGGWIGLVTEAQIELVRLRLSRACRLFGTESGPLGWMAGRTLGAAHAADQRWDDAAEAMAFAYACAPDRSTLVAQARWMAAAGDLDKARHIVGEVLAEAPVLCGCVWSHPEFADVRPYAAERLTALHAESAEQWVRVRSEWSELVAKFGVAGLPTVAPQAEFEDAATQGRTGFLPSTVALDKAEQMVQDLRETLESELGGRFDKALADWRSLKGELTDLKADRDSELASAERRKGSSLASLESKSTDNRNLVPPFRTGALWGLAIGFCGLLLYLGLVVALDFAGYQVQMGSPLVLVGVALVGVPLVTLATAFVWWTVRRNGVASQVSAAQESVQQEYDASVASIQEQFEEESNRLESAVVKAHDRVREAEAKFWAVGMPVPARPDWTASSNPDETVSDR